MKKKFKSYVSIRKALGYFIISSDSGLNDTFIKINEQNEKLLELLKTTGLNDSVIDKSDMKILNSLNLFENINSNTINGERFRSDMFFECLNISLTESIKHKKILIFGSGGGGGTLIYLLAQQGFSNIICVDYDIVESSDVFKTFVYHKQDIGKSKTKALQNNIKMNFNVDISTIETRINNGRELLNIIEETIPELVVYAIDPDPVLKLEIDSICHEKNLPLIFMAYSFEKIVCGPFLVPGYTSCMIGYNESLKMHTNGIMDMKLVKKLNSENTIHPSMTFIINILASFIFKDIIMFLTGQLNSITTLNTIVVYDVLTLEGNAYELSCNLCSSCSYKDNRTK